MAITHRGIIQFDLGVPGLGEWKTHSATGPNMIDKCNSGKTEPPHGTAKKQARSCLPPLASEKGNRPDFPHFRKVETNWLKGRED